MGISVYLYKQHYPSARASNITPEYNRACNRDSSRGYGRMVHFIRSPITLNQVCQLVWPPIPIRIFILRFLILPGIKKSEICINKLKSRSKRWAFLPKVNWDVSKKNNSIAPLCIQRSGLGPSCAPKDSLHWLLSSWAPCCGHLMSSNKQCFSGFDFKILLKASDFSV